MLPQMYIKARLRHKTFTTLVAFERFRFGMFREDVHVQQTLQTEALRTLLASTTEIITLKPIPKRIRSELLVSAFGDVPIAMRPKGGVLLRRFIAESASINRM